MIIACVTHRIEKKCLQLMNYQRRVNPFKPLDQECLHKALYQPIKQDKLDKDFLLRLMDLDDELDSTEDKPPMSQAKELVKLLDILREKFKSISSGPPTAPPSLTFTSQYNIMPSSTSTNSSRRSLL